MERSGRKDEFDVDSCGTGGGSSDWQVPLGPSACTSCTLQRQPRDGLFCHPVSMSMLFPQWLSNDHPPIPSIDTASCSPGRYRVGGFSYHEGDDADPRMKEVASKRGVQLTSISRPLKPEDFDRWMVFLSFLRRYRAMYTMTCQGHDGCV